MHIEKAIRNYLIEIEVRKHTPKTIRSYRNNLSLFLRFCEEKPVINTFTENHVRMMLRSCQGRDYMSLRDTAVLTLLFETSIRCWELSLKLTCIVER